MPVRPGFRVTTAGSVLDAIRAKSLKGAKELTASVGYRCPYAVYVHEDPAAFHPVGNWKFLEGPARRGRGYMAAIVKAALKQKRSLEYGILQACDWLRDASRAEVPYDTGRLYRSWFQRVLRRS